MTGLDIRPDRLLRRIAQLAEIGRDESGGITRPAFSAADHQARRYLIGQAAAAGLSPGVDAAGNIIVRRPPGSTLPSGTPALLMGSHLDTVVGAGRLDGAYGVVAALEVLQVISEAGVQLEHEPVAIAFANEEGALFPQPFWGSMAVAGRLAALPDDPRDHQGESLREPLHLVGGDLDDLPSAVWPPGSAAAFLELHIEQGAELERSGKQIGIVDVISGRTMLTVEVRGTAGHAGTTPMPGRRDALAAAARVVSAVEALAADDELCRVSTVSRVDVYPNTSNTIAGSVRLTVDIRDTDAGRIAAAEASLTRVLEAVAERTGTELKLIAAVRSGPVHADDVLREAIERSAAELGLAHDVLPSGAGHDALVIADIAPIGLIFVPSIGGLSHVPDEDTADADLIAGARVLLHTALRAAALDAG